MYLDSQAVHLRKSGKLCRFSSLQIYLLPKEAFSIGFIVGFYVSILLIKLFGNVLTDP